LVERGRGPEALTHLRIAVRLSPSAPQQRVLCARLLAAAGAASELRTFFAETRRINASEPGLPTWPSYETAFNEGLRAIDARDWLSAAHAAREALRHDPRSADALNNLGWSLAQLGFHDDAARSYEQAIALQPDHERAKNNLALLRR